MQRLDRYAAVGVFLLGVILRVRDVSDVKTRTPDERTYTAYAQNILDHGFAGIRSSASDWVRDTRRLYPLPIRIGYTVPLAAAMRISGRRDAIPGSWISMAASVFALGIAILIGRRFFHPWIGVLGGLFLAVFPADLAIARRAWIDAPLACAGLVMLYCALAIVAGKRGRRPFLGLILAGSAGMLIKEIAAPIYGLCVVLCLCALLHRKEWKPALLLAGASCASVALAAAAIAGAVGGWGLAASIVGGLNSANAVNQYALDYTTGPAYDILAGLWKISPAVAVLSIAGLFVTFRRRLPAGVALGAFTILFGALPVVLPHWLNLRYISILFAPLCLFAAIASFEAVRAARRRLTDSDFTMAAAAAAAALLLACVADYQRFQRVWVEHDTQDLSIRMILES